MEQLLVSGFYSDDQVIWWLCVGSGRVTEVVCRHGRSGKARLNSA